MGTGMPPACPAHGQAWVRLPTCPDHSLWSRLTALSLPQAVPLWAWSPCDFQIASSRHPAASPLVLDRTGDGSTFRSAALALSRAHLGTSSLPLPSPHPSPLCTVHLGLITVSCAHSRAWRMAISMTGPGVLSSRTLSRGFRSMLGTPPASQASSPRAGTLSGGEAGSPSPGSHGQTQDRGGGYPGATDDLSPCFLPGTTGSRHTRSSSAMTVRHGGGAGTAAVGWMW